MLTTKRLISFGATLGLLSMLAFPARPVFAASHSESEQEVAQSQTNGVVTIECADSCTELADIGSHKKGDDPFQHAQGNIGVNNAAGGLNQQSNSLFVNVIRGDHKGGKSFEGQSEITQDSSNPQVDVSFGLDGSGKSIVFEGNEASIGGNAFEFVSGNVGVNNAAGYFNQQANAAFIETGSMMPKDGNGDDPSRRKYEQTVSQELSGNGLRDNTTDELVDNIENSGGHNASLEDNAFSHATGNIGVNNASGNANQQANDLILSSVDKGIRYEGSIEQEQDASNAVGIVNMSGGFTVNDSGFNEGAIEDNAFENAMGNIGVNNAAGNGNQQANVAAIFGSEDPSNGASSMGMSSMRKGSSADVSIEQSIAWSAVFQSGDNDAQIQDNAFENVAGNVGLNNAAGNLNQQNNYLFLLSASNGELQKVSIEKNQSSYNAFIEDSAGNTAEIEDNAFKNAQGNIGVNNAAGNLNQQSNDAVIHVH